MPHANQWQILIFFCNFYKTNTETAGSNPIFFNSPFFDHTSRYVSALLIKKYSEVNTHLCSHTAHTQIHIMCVHTHTQILEHKRRECGDQIKGGSGPENNS